MSTFEDLNVKEEVVKALKEDGIYNPTNIQEQSIPLFHDGKDVVGMSRTGSGKTAAFGIPVIEKMKPSQGLQAIILTPTRELAVQIAREMTKWAKYTDVQICTVYGGVAFDPQVENMLHCEIVVGTPGRVLDHLQKGTMKTDQISTFVLDEADKMVEMGFIEDIDRIIQATPDGRQVILFGATLSSEIDNIKARYMPNAVVAESELHVEKDLLKQYYYEVQQREKFSLLVHLLKKEDIDLAMIFCSSRSTVELLHTNLKAQGMKAEMMHGKLSQNRRQRVIDNFNKGKPNILIASAVAARGLDIRDVSHIFNYDLSRDPQEYVHRVGRTARAGAEGKAITLLSDKDYQVFSQVLNRYGIEIELLVADKFEKLRFLTQSRDSGSRFGGRGPRGGGYQGNKGGYRGNAGSRSGGLSSSKNSGGRSSSLSSSGWNG